MAAPRPGFAMNQGQPGRNDTADDTITGTLLPRGAVADLTELRRDHGIDEILTALDADLVGLHEVKARIRELAALLVVDRVRTRFGIAVQRPNLHMCFTGGPGTGKTTVALRMAGLLHKLGYLRTGQLLSVTRDDLVGQYVGHTAPKTKDVLRRAMGGLLFIDEAYYLYRVDNERDYGQESVEILLQVMEHNRDDLVVVLAGYADRMDTFFRSNPGMASRVAHHIRFPGYTVGELEQIGGLMTADLGYTLTAGARSVFRDQLARQRAQPGFANARSVRNAVEGARLRQASRLLEQGRVTRSDVVTLTTADLDP
jgi:probable Rubsico expression protein CbbX